MIQQEPKKDKREMHGTYYTCWKEHRQSLEMYVRPEERSSPQNYFNQDKARQYEEDIRCRFLQNSIADMAVSILSDGSSNAPRFVQVQTFIEPLLILVCVFSYFIKFSIDHFRILDVVPDLQER